MSTKFHVKKSGDRGHAHHGWLKTYHHFPFAAYYDPSERFQDFGSLRVINEDRVEPSEGFGTHSHSEYEIWSYIVDGELEHKDSMGNLEIMKRGEVQMTSTGTGIRHSEYNRNKDVPVHFLQMWAKPNKSRLPPKYYNREFSDQDKTDKIVTIVAPVEDADVVDERNANGPAPVHSNLRVHASILTPSKSIPFHAKSNSNKILVHNIMRSGYRKPAEKAIQGGAVLDITSGTEHCTLEEGDSLFIDSKLESPLEIASKGPKQAEFLIFEMF